MTWIIMWDNPHLHTVIHLYTSSSSSLWIPAIIMQLVSKRVYVWILVSCAYYKNGHVGKGHTGQQGSNKVTKHRRKDGKNDRSISMSFIKQKEKETTIVKHYSLRRPISWARSVASRSSMRHTDPRIKSIPTSHCPQTFGNTAARSPHPQDSEVHDTATVIIIRAQTGKWTRGW